MCVCVRVCVCSQRCGHWAKLSPNSNTYGWDNGPRIHNLYIICVCVCVCGGLPLRRSLLPSSLLLRTGMASCGGARKSESNHMAASETLTHHRHHHQDPVCARVQGSHRLCHIAALHTVVRTYTRTHTHAHTHTPRSHTCPCTPFLLRSGHP